MDAGNIDWVFDTSREGTFPRGEGGFWRLILKYWLLEVVLACLGTVAVIVTLFLRPKDVPIEFLFAVVMGGMILSFCVFLVWMTYRRHPHRRDLQREAEDMALNREVAQYCREKRQRGFLMSVCLVMLGACSLCAAESNTDGVPFVTWTSRSGNGPFTELRSEKFVSAGWLKWLGEAHKLYCDIDVNRGEEYSMRISMPPNMCLTHVSWSKEFSCGLTSCDQDLDWWCTVRRKKDCAEIVIWPSQCRRTEWRFGFHEGGFCSWGSIRMDETPKRTFVVDDTASEYDWNQKVYKTLSARPCSTPMEAARIAEGIFLRTYERNSYKKNLYLERPWRVTDTNGCYLVTGSLPKGRCGGVSQLKLRKSDGFVWLYYHGK